jgi:hypothetical protein
MLYTVITTIQEPTRCVHALASALNAHKAVLISVGDKKGPKNFHLDAFDDARHLIFLPLAQQPELDYSIIELLPEGSYARKNIGYLSAVTSGATCIYETDDDNAPLENWKPRTEVVESSREVSADAPDWINVYQFFTDALIWPRGLPLDEIRQEHATPPTTFVAGRRAPIQQALVNGSPDVDAIWRLLMDREFLFADCPAVYLPPGKWCPFNTQSTWWWPIAYPLLYIPSYCSFRMCDIWKSFVAQRCLWEMGHGIAFHAPEVYQDRNAHNLMSDFTQEISGYTHNKRIVHILEEAHLRAGPTHVADNLHICYEKLVSHDIFPSKELKLVEAWLTDVTLALPE